MKGVVFGATIPGILAYADGKPIGWCSIAPREEFGSLERSRTLKRMNDKPVWSIVCIFVRKDFYSMGMMGELIRGAMKYAKIKGARIIEASPDIPDKKDYPLKCIWAV